MNGVRPLTQPDNRWKLNLSAAQSRIGLEHMFIVVTRLELAREDLLQPAMSVLACIKMTSVRVADHGVLSGLLMHS